MLSSDCFWLFLSGGGNFAIETAELLLVVDATETAAAAETCRFLMADAELETLRSIECVFLIFRSVVSGRETVCIRALLVSEVERDG